MKTVFASLIALLALTGAQAAPLFYTVDGFASPGVSLAGPGVSSASDAQRAVTFTAFNRRSTLLIGTGSFNDSTLDISNPTGFDATAAVSWSLAAGALPANAVNVSLLFDVVSSDAGTSKPIDFVFEFGAAGLTSYSLTSNSADIAVGMSSADLARLTAGGQLVLTIDGSLGWDVALNSVRFSYEVPTTTAVPEPTSIALMGLGLLAAGLVRRRKV